ncbi:MAG: DUF805 domain-containing protein [Paludibacter sp.]
MNYYFRVLRKYVDFKGRLSRKEYWMYVLFTTIFALIAAIIDNLIGTTVGKTHLGIFFYIYLIAIASPDLAADVRRLHDVGKSGSFMIVLLIPFIGIIWYIIVLSKEGVAGENEYGANPIETLIEEC